MTYERAVVSFEEKEGRSGKIAICAVRHKWSKVYGDPVLDELQSIVYLPPTSTSTTVPSDPSNQELAREGDVHLTPVDLFRYSAVTFNSHRIHYDLRYATEVEGYPALVVHGPFLAMVLAGWAEQTREAKLSEFNFRNVNPLFLGQGFGYFMHGNNYEIRSARETCVKATASFREG
ncbi:MAG: hypothetical protein K8F90_09170 [Hyphomicrobiales bacterium]|nr:hypothetical protein [Hyphomicrobiales bacterium]